jgi:Ca2+-binding RTX toxin-like protein
MTGTPKQLDDSALSQVSGGNFTDRWGTAGADTISTGDGMDKIFAGAGNDLISSGGGTDEIHAGAGDDDIHAGAGDDKVFGGDGHDSIRGGAGFDELHGEGGHDAMDGGVRDGAADKAFGGDGDDRYIWSPGSGNDEFHGGTGQDALVLLNVSLEALQGGLQLYGSGLQMQLGPNGAVTFTDANGQPATFSGQLSIGGETLKFFDVERLHIQA